MSSAEMLSSGAIELIKSIIADLTKLTYMHNCTYTHKHVHVLSSFIGENTMSDRIRIHEQRT